MQWTVVRKIYRNGWYLALTVFLLALFVTLILLVPNWQLISSVLTAETATLNTKLSIIAGLYGSLISNQTLAGAVYVLTISFLSAVNITFLVYYIRRAQSLTRGHKGVTTTSFIGLVSGVFGIGCAACGSVILSSVAAGIGATGLLILLPFHGVEFAVIGITLLVLSIYLLLKKINDPLVCRIR